jgi:hypothetical protein
MKMRHCSQFRSSAIVLASLLPTLCLAQTAPNRSRVNVIHVKPDMVNEFIELEKNEVVPALKKGGAKSRTVYRTTTFGPGFEFVVVTPFQKFSEFDGDSAQLKALGAAANAKLTDKLRKTIVSVDSYLITQAPDLSNTIQNSKPPAMIVTTRYRVSPGKMQDFETLIKNEVVPGFKKAKMALNTNHRGMGANPNDVTFTSPMTKYAEMDLGSAAVRALGQDTVTKLGPKVTALATNVETVVRTREADLSF